MTKLKSRTDDRGGRPFLPPFSFSPGLCSAGNTWTRSKAPKAFDEGWPGLSRKMWSCPRWSWPMTPPRSRKNSRHFEKYADVYAQNSDLVGWISIPDTPD